MQPVTDLSLPFSPVDSISSQATMANVDVNTENDVEQPYLVSEIAIRETNLKLVKVKITTNTKKKTKARKKDHTFLFSLDPAQWVLLDSLESFQMLTYSGVFRCVSIDQYPTSLCICIVRVAF